MLLVILSRQQNNMSSPRRVGLQNIIPNSNIVIDHWDMKSSSGHDRRIRFMTSIKNHSPKSISHLRKAKYSIHTSLFNKWYLHQFYGISENRIIVLDFDKTIEIFDPDRNEKFCVTTIEANYCSGSTMFLFQGPFGNILYTGYFRTSSATQIHDSPALKQLIMEKSLHVAYIDNSYAAEHCTFPTRHETIQNIIRFIRCSKNCDIFISSNALGKEEVLLAIASELDEKIHVGSQRYDIFYKLGVSDFFTRNVQESRIRALDQLLSLRECYQRFDENKSCVIILLTALYAYGPKKFPLKSKFPRLRIIPYSGHCNHAELKQFVSSLRPHTILPIIKYQSHRPCSVIPQSIYDLCLKERDVRDSGKSKFFEPINEKYLPVVLIPRFRELRETPSRVVESEFTSVTEGSFAEEKQSEPSITPVFAVEIANEKCPKESLETCENSCDSPQRIGTNLQVPSEDVSAEKENCPVPEERHAVSAIEKNIVPKCMAEEMQLERKTQTEESLGIEVLSVDEYITAVDVSNSCGVGSSNLTFVRSPLENIFDRVESCDILTDFTRPNSDKIPPQSMVENAEFCDNEQLIDEYIIEEEVHSNDDVDKSIVSTLPSPHDGEACVNASSELSSEVNEKRMDSVKMEIDLQEVKRSIQNSLSENYRSILESGSNCSDSPTKKIDRSLPFQPQNVQVEGNEFSLSTSPKSSCNRIFSSEGQEVLTVSVAANANYVNPISVPTPQVGEKISVNCVISDVCNLQLTSNHDVSDPLFGIDEHCSKNQRPNNDTGLPMVGSSLSVVKSASVVQSENCEPINFDRFPINCDLALKRSRIDCQPCDEDAPKLSDSSDCVIVAEYVSKAGFNECNRASKKLRLDSAQRNDSRNVLFSKNNDQFVNAILFHFCKLYDPGKNMLASDQWDFLSDCNIFSHSAYRI